MLRPSAPVVVLVLLLASRAAAQDPCHTALSAITAGQLAEGEALLRTLSPDEPTACGLYAWGRVAEARHELARASLLYLRAARLPSSPSLTASDLAARASALPVAARIAAERADTDPTSAAPSLAMLRELLRAALETDGWYPQGSVACAVERRARAAGLEAVLLRRTAERLSRDEELLLAVHGASGWRVVAHVTPLVQNGHGQRGALAVLGLTASPGRIIVRTRSWQSEDDGTPPPWVHAQVRCTGREDRWTC